MFDDLYPQAVEYSNRDRLAGKAPPADPGWFKGFWRAAANAVPAAGLETGSAISGLLTEYGRAAAFTQGAPAAESIDKIGAPDPAGQMMRREAKTFTPDPATTGLASQIVFGMGKTMTKAAASFALGGVPGMVAGTGVLEAGSETQKLQDEGVDFATAAKVGVVHGAITGATIGLPIAGKGLRETIGLVVAGGPVSFMAEQAASRAILDAADYKKIAEQYDPFDPVGLGVSTVLASVFGGAAHGARAVKAARVAREAEAAKAAEPAIRPTPEQEAAARVVQMNEHIEATNLSGFHDARGAAAHVDALNAAKRQMDAGQPVQVGALVNDAHFGEPAPLAMNRVAAAIRELTPKLPEAEVHAQALEMVRAEHEPDLIAVAGQTESKIADVRSQVKELEAQVQDLTVNRAESIKATARDLQAQLGLKFKAAMKEAEKLMEQKVADLEATRQRLTGELAKAKEAEAARQELDQLASGKVPERLKPAHEERVNEVRRQFDERPMATAVREVMNARRAPPPAGEKTLGIVGAIRNLRPVLGSDQAKAVVSEIVDRPLLNADSGITATVSRSTYRKMMSESSVRNSVSPQAHLQALGNLDQLFPHALLRESRPSNKQPQTVAAIHNFDVPMPFDGQVLNVRILAKEHSAKSSGTRIYDIKAVEIVKPATSEGITASPVLPTSPTSVSPAGFSDRFAKLTESVKSFLSDAAKTAQEPAGATKPAEGAQVSPEPKAAASATPAKGAGTSEPADAHELAAKQIAEADPAAMGLDETGAMRPISEILADAAKAFEQEVKDAGAFTAGVNCFLRH